MFFSTGITCLLDVQPTSAVRYEHESVEFKCVSDATNPDNPDQLLPTDWLFLDQTGHKLQIFLSGVLTISLRERFAVDKSIPQAYTLHISNLTLNDSGTYICVGSAGLGPQLNATLTVAKGNDRQTDL